MKDRKNVIIVDIDHLNADYLKKMGEFFSEQENGALGNMIFEQDHIYDFSGNRQIIFNKEIIGYQKNKINLWDKTEWIYSVRSDESLGKGAFGSVYKTSGKLVHESDGSMRYITPAQIK